MSDLSALEARTGVTFSDKRLIEQAFIHRSYLNENPAKGREHNERLEFLGDAVLELAVTDWLFREFPDKTEGDLTAYRAALVNAVTLGEAADELSMNDYLMLSKGEQKDTGRARHAILANALESFVGAVYLDQGYAAAEGFIGRTLFHKLPRILERGAWKDAKSAVQEKVQDALGVTPSYRVLKQVGPDHDRVFTVGIFFGETLVAEGSGRSKQEAEQEAAKSALAAKGWK